MIAGKDKKSRKSVQFRKYYICIFCRIEIRRTIFISVFRIRDILVRIRILGSVPTLLTYPDPDPAVFVSDPQNANKNNCSAYDFFKVHLHHSSQIQKVLKNSQSNRNQGFLLDDGRIRIGIRPSD
jgi:hypothetical protein